MGSDLQDIFRLAARHFYKQYKKKGGSQAEIAKKLGITPPYLSSVINGSKTASIELQSQLANILYGPYEEFLVAGRRIQKNLDPEIKKLPEPKEGVEKLIAELTYYVMDHQRIEKELANIKNFYEDIVQNLQSGVLVTDSEDNIFFVNNYMFKIFNIPIEQLLGKNCRSMQNEFSQVDIAEFSEKHIEAKESLKPLFYERGFFHLLPF